MAVSLIYDLYKIITALNFFHGFGGPVLYDPLKTEFHLIEASGDSF